MINKYKVIFFDFDGVIADSVKIKSDAFFELYKSFGENVANKVVHHHEKNGGVSRYKKIKYYHESFLDKKVDDEELNRITDKFSKIVVNKVINAPEIKGARAFLKKYHRIIDMWLISATPIEEIRQIVEMRGISEYFKGVFGFPAHKDRVVAELIKNNSYNKSRCLFIGDSYTDYEAAKKNKIDFCLVQADWCNANHKIRFKYKIDNFNNVIKKIHHS